MLHLRAGISLGLRNSIGLGSFIALKKNGLESSLGVGVTAFNGFKTSLGLKYSGGKYENVQSVFSINYTRTIHENIGETNDPDSEYYFTSDNQYINGGIGVSISSKRNELIHQVVMGYTQNLNEYRITPGPQNTSNRLYPKIKYFTRGGLMLSYIAYLW
ncbi:MAG: hypothetical protein GC181_10910 [Bacteroidetes bacterium]|nr:hypothetical protein [Bacteroidota bacterium]